MKTSIRFGFAVSVVLALVHPASGTNRYYANVVAVSADGKLRLEAKSPDNADGKRRPFAKDFVYVLSETATGRPLWDRKPGRERPPVRAWVHDGG
jgi:hypothetical protein